METPSPIIGMVLFAINRRAFYFIIFHIICSHAMHYEFLYQFNVNQPLSTVTCVPVLKHQKGELIRLITKIFGRVVTSMSDVYIYIYIGGSGGSGGMLPQKIFRN